MPPLKIRNLFISHAWKYDSHYDKVVEWFNSEPNFNWKNYSVPKDDACPNRDLENCLLNQMKPSQGIIILAGMYASHSEWIEYEIREAYRMRKPIIGVKPWGSERTPQIIQDYATALVGWNSFSVINAVRNLT